jgi:glycosyltransferase involved in cell wall biosynthesis
MALRAPIVASDIPPVAEAVTDGLSARLVPAGQPEAFAGALVETLSDREAAEARAERAEADFQARFTIRRAADGMLAFYDHAVSAVR